MAKLSFYTTGESMYERIWDFLKSGQFKNAIDVLESCGFDKVIIYSFLRGAFKMVGDTENGLALEPVSDVEFLEKRVDDIFTGWCTSCAEDGYEYHEYREGNEHVKALFKYFDKESFFKIYREQILKSRGYEMLSIDDINEFEDDDDEKLRNGVITSCGHFIECGFQQHSSLFPVLYGVGLSTTSSWFDTGERMVMHVTSGQISGYYGHLLKNGKMFKKDTQPSKEQIELLYHLRNHIYGFYGKRTITIPSALLLHETRAENNGSKYGGLAFLSKFKDFKIPRYSKEPLGGKYVIRTSPTRSIGGLLTSYFDVTEENHDETIVKMKNDFDKYRNIVSDNEFNYFYQEQIEGKNGVAFQDENGFTIGISDNRGDIVGGKHSDKVPYIVEYYLKSILDSLYNDFRRPTQVEYVFDGSDVYFVQLRVFESEKFETIEVPKDAIKGKPFKRGDIKFQIEDCLIIDSECESKELIGKKALIVRDDVNFSHALALSKSLNIPSIYGVGDFEPTKIMSINTKGEVGFIKLYNN